MCAVTDRLGGDGHWQWGVQYEFDPLGAFDNDPEIAARLNPDGTVTRVRWAEDEVSNTEHTMRCSVACGIPSVGKNRRVVRRWVGPVEVVPPE